jgi:hypothetical protein
VRDEQRQKRLKQLMRPSLLHKSFFVERALIVVFRTRFQDGPGRARKRACGFSLSVTILFPARAARVFCASRAAGENGTFPPEQ